jgi:hypothetical protein
VLRDVQVGHRLDDCALDLVEMAGGDEVLCECSGAIERPGLEGSH